MVALPVALAVALPAAAVLAPPAAAAAALPAAALAQAEYTVQPRDTLEVIARRHDTTVSAIAGENGLADPNFVIAGTVLRIPGGGAGGSAAGTGAGATHHVVGLGESLSGIARRYGLSVAQLAEWNGLGNPNMVQAGARISVGGPAAQNVATSRGGTHRIAPGETLGGIALRSGVSVTELARANGIADPDRVIAGSTLTIPGGWHCPVRGLVSFVNDFGITKPGDRFHDGVDLYAPRGTPVVAPVAGRVEQVRGERAGLQFRLHGVDGHVYVGTHMDAFGAAGQVQAGEVLGTVGSTGNALGTSPHLHFEIHAGGQRLTNPYPSLRTACR